MDRDDIKSLFFKLCIPAVIAQLINIAYNVVDRIFVGRIHGVGHIALTGIGVSMPIIVCVSAFSMLVGMGGAPKAAIALGEKNKNKAEEILGVSTFMLLIIGIILSIIVYIFREKILYLFGASENTFKYANEYLSIYILGSIFVLISIGLNTFITTQGKAKTAMFTVLIGAILNIVLDPIFIFKFNMGVSGAALATILSQGISAIYVIRFLISENSIIKIKLKYLKLKKEIVLGVLALGLSPFIMQITESILQIVFNRSLLYYGGDLYVGAMTIIATIMQFMVLPLNGFTQGAQPITSYNFGAKNFNRLKASVRILTKTCFSYALILNILIFLFPEFFVRIFTKNTELINATVKYLRVYMAGTIVFGLQIAAQSSFIAVSNAKYSIFFATLRKIILLIPLIFILPLFLKEKVFAVFLAEPIADTLSGVATYSTFRIYLKKLE